MAARNRFLADFIHDYILARGVREPDVAAALRMQTAERPDGFMQSPPELGQLLAFLVTLTGARRILELGTFTGYGALRMALAMPLDGRLIACDVNESAHDLARSHWQEAGVADRIDLRVGEVADILPKLHKEGFTEGFDMIFVDADKPGYAAYYEAGLDLLRPGGLMVFDNVFVGGSVARPDIGHRHAKHAGVMEAFNARLQEDQRIDFAMLPVGDGVALAVKRA